jgi:hypothetical protein
LKGNIASLEGEEKMALLEAISSALGPTAVGVTLAAAIYAGATSVEKEASATAKSDIARFLKGFRGTLDLSLVSRHILHFFEIILGKKHLSLKCIRRSMMLTTACCYAILLAFVSKRHSALEKTWSTYFPDTNVAYNSNPLLFNFLWILTVIVMVFAITAPIDYVSFWKSRILLKYVSGSRRLRAAAVFTVLDIVLSIAIYILYLQAYNVTFLNHKYSFWDLITDFPIDLAHAYAILFGYGEPNSGDALVAIFVTSTILTSIWTVAVLVAAILLRLFISLKYPVGILTWLFDVEEHPIKILGIMLALFVWVASCAYGLA